MSLENAAFGRSQDHELAMVVIRLKIISNVEAVLVSDIEEGLHVVVFQIFQLDLFI